jgi:rhodanese-related sulfurtransferase
MTGRILLTASDALLLAVISFGGCSSSTTTTSAKTMLETTTAPPGTTTATTPPATTTPTLPEVDLVRPEVLRITAEEMKSLMDSGKDVVVVDTRAGIDFEKGHINGAINIPTFPLGLSLEQKLLRLPENQLIVFYCDSMNDLEAANLALKLIDFDYDSENVKALRGVVLVDNSGLCHREIKSLAYQTEKQKATSIYLNYPIYRYLCQS